MIKEDEIIMVGRFFKPHGLKGELNVLTEYDSDILDHGYPMIVDINGIYVPFYAESVRPKGHFSSLVKLEHVDSEEEASPFVNREFSMLKRDVSEYLDIPEDELIVEMDYIGYKVFDSKRGYIGRVVYVDSSTDNLLLHVLPEGMEDTADNLIFIPFDDNLIEYEVDYADDDEDGGDDDGDGNDDRCGEIHMILPEGLLDLNVAD